MASSTSGSTGNIFARLNITDVNRRAQPVAETDDLSAKSTDSTVYQAQAGAMPLADQQTDQPTKSLSPGQRLAAKVKASFDADALSFENK